MSQAEPSESDIIAWLEKVSGEEVENCDILEFLRSGIVLCTIANKIRQGIIPNINSNAVALGQVENIAFYLQACWKLGLPSDDMFVTADLFQKRNKSQVLNNLVAVSKLAQKYGAKIPVIGDVEAEAKPNGDADENEALYNQIKTLKTRLYELEIRNEELADENLSLKEQLVQNNEELSTLRNKTEKPLSPNAIMRTFSEMTFDRNTDEFETVSTPADTVTNTSLSESMVRSGDTVTKSGGGGKLPRESWRVEQKNARIKLLEQQVEKWKKLYREEAKYARKATDVDAEHKSVEVGRRTLDMAMGMNATVDPEMLSYAGACLQDILWSRPVEFSEMQKLSYLFKSDFGRRSFAKILDNFVKDMPSVLVSENSFELLLFLVNTTLQEMDLSDSKDIISVRILMKTSCSLTRQNSRGETEYIQEFIKNHEVWKNIPFWEEYFWVELAQRHRSRYENNISALEVIDQELVTNILSSFAYNMHNWGVSADDIFQFVMDTCSRNNVNQADIVLLLENIKVFLKIEKDVKEAKQSDTKRKSIQHNFRAKNFLRPDWCDCCKEFIWGVLAKQGYKCQDCNMIIHGHCLEKAKPLACDQRTRVKRSESYFNKSGDSRTGFEGLPPEVTQMLKTGGISKPDVIAHPHVVADVLGFHMNGASTTSKHDSAGENPIKVGGAEADVIGEFVNRSNPNTVYRDFVKIGQGGSGEIFVASHVTTSEKVAIKKIHLRPQNMKIILNEISILRDSDHKNIIQYKDCYVVEEELWVVLEYIDGGSLTEVLDLFPTFVLEEPHMARVCLCVLRALEYIHSLGRIHRDIKSDNVLLSKEGRIILADFGNAAQLTADCMHRESVVGTPYWMAPELIQAMPYNFKVDTWSLGILLRELAEAEPPFAEFPPLKTLFLLTTQDIPPLKAPQKWSKDFTSFMNSCLQRDVSKRPTASQLLQHAFLKKACTQEEFKKFVERALVIRKEMFSKLK